MNYRVIINYLFLIALLPLTSCSNHEENYTPMIASYMQRYVEIKIESKDGSLLDYDSLLNNQGIKAWSNLSKSQLPLSVTNNDKGDRYITLYTDTPNQTLMSFSENRRSGVGTSTATLHIGKQQFELILFYKFMVADWVESHSYGGSSLFIDAIECRGLHATMSDGMQSPRIILTQKENGEFYIRQVE